MAFTARNLTATLMVLATAAAAPAQVERKEPAPLRFGAVSFYNPRLMYLKYQPLVDYLSRYTGRPWELAVSSSYESSVEQLCSGELAAAYLGPFTYLRALARCGAIPVVRLNTHGKATYQALIMVRQESPITSLAQLAGKRFGFGAPLSTSSHLVPRAMLLAAGLQPGRDYTCRYLWHHEKAAREVLLGGVDASGVRDIVGEKFVQRGLRVLASSEPIPNFPFVISPLGPAGVREELVHALVMLPLKDPAIQAAISEWDEELAGGFALAAASDFEPVRTLARLVFGPLALRRPEAELGCEGRGP